MANAVASFRWRHTYGKIERTDIINWLRKYCKKWAFQLEEGDSGYKHYQGNLSLVKKRRVNELSKLFTDIEMFEYIKPAHDVESVYELKEDTRIDGPWTSEDEVVYIPRQYRHIKDFYPYQLDILKWLTEFEIRKCKLIYDPKGCRGKTTIASIAELKYGAIDLPPLNDLNDIISMLCDECMGLNLRNPSGVFFDLPRAMDKTRLHGIFSSFEQIKKGKLFDKRYKYKKWWIDSPQIFIFTNWIPDLDMLSKDRWELLTINESNQFEALTLEKPQIDFLDI